MFIDIGAKDKEEAEEFGVRPGDSIVPYFEFTPMKMKRFFLQKHGTTVLVARLRLKF